MQKFSGSYSSPVVCLWHVVGRRVRYVPPGMNVWLSSSQRIIIPVFCCCLLSVWSTNKYFGFYDKTGWPKSRFSFWPSRLASWHSLRPRPHRWGELPRRRFTSRWVGMSAIILEVEMFIASEYNVSAVVCGIWWEDITGGWVAFFLWQQQTVQQ